MNLDLMLSKVVDWVKYAEAKNAVLVVFDSSLLIALLSLLADKQNTFLIPCWYIIISIVLLIVSAALSLFSFMPILKIIHFNNTNKTEELNLFHFGDIAQINAETYIDLLKIRYGFDCCSEIDKDLANQILVNSRVAVYKLRIFRIALWLTLSVFLSPLVLLVLVYWEVRKFNDK